IGRGDGNIVRLSDDTAVSHNHAIVELKAGQPVVRDLGSTNGTLVYRDGRWYRVNGESRLRTGDLLAVGTTQFRFAIGA
ncbi:MAG: FHA domain-containing protein, partial [Bradyrhizobium sp.]